VADDKKVCLRCGSAHWADSGQKRKMTSLRQVFASTSDRDSRIGDESEQRSPEFFNKQLLVDFEDSNIKDAYKVEDSTFPFGFEFITKATLREVNFGKKDDGGEEIRIAGFETPRSGFSVCKHCGKVQRKSKDSKKLHTLSCPARQKKENHRVFCMMGDGETCEGEIWEAANTAGSYHLGNLVGIVDKNKQLMTSRDGEFMVLEPLADRWRAFNWDVVEIDGHNMGQIVDTLDNLPPITHKKPTMIVCNTIKGKGISFMERDIGWHAGALSKEDMEKAISEVEVACSKEGSAV